jgi:hypothetical protein
VINDRKPPTPPPAAETYSERRRSHRVHITMPILVRGTAGKERFEEQAQTVAVSAHGCLLRLAAAVDRAQEISIVNPRTAEELPCTITFVGQKEAGKCEIGVEFTEASPLFWRIAFPPEDWDPSERKRATNQPQRPPSSTPPRR